MQSSEFPKKGLSPCQELSVVHVVEKDYPLACPRPCHPIRAVVAILSAKWPQNKFERQIAIDNRKIVYWHY